MFRALLLPPVPAGAGWSGSPAARCARARGTSLGPTASAARTRNLEFMFIHGASQEMGKHVLCFGIPAASQQAPRHVSPPKNPVKPCDLWMGPEAEAGAARATNLVGAWPGVAWRGLAWRRTVSAVSQVQHSAFN